MLTPRCVASSSSRRATPPLIFGFGGYREDSDVYFFTKPLSYWSERGDLNSRPPVPQNGAAQAAISSSVLLSERISNNRVPQALSASRFSRSYV